MFSTLRRVLSQLDLEEKILNAGALIGFIGVLCPWIGGEWLGGTPVLHTGFGFYTSFLGLAVFLLNGFILFVILSPLLGGPSILRREQRNIALLVASAQAVVLSIAALSVLTRVAFEFSRVEIRFGIYMSMIGSLTASLYAFLKFQEERRRMAESFFHHAEPVKKAPPPTGEAAPKVVLRAEGGSGREERFIPRKPEPVVLKKIEVPVAVKEERRELVEKIKEESIRPPERVILPAGRSLGEGWSSIEGRSPDTIPQDETIVPPPPPKVIPKAPAVEEHPIFRGL